MTWFINQSLLFIVIAFLLGLLVGYLWWGRQVRRIRTQETTTTPAAAQPLVAAAPVEPVKDEASSAAEPLPAEPAAADPIVAEPAPVAVAEPETEAAFAAEPVAEPVAEVEAPVESVEAAPSDVDDELVADVESAFAAAPVAQDAPEDDLARIEGIGPKIAAALKAAGITTFAALADAERSTLEDALANANLRFAPSIGSWGRQARLLADGDEEGFKELTDWLIAGREPVAKPTASSDAGSV